MRAALPWVLAFVVVLVLSNLRELLEQVLKIRIAHRLRGNLTPPIADKVANLQYWCFEDSHTHDLIHRVGNDPEGQFTQGFWQLLFAPSFVVTLGGLAAIFMQTSWWVLPSVLLLAIPAVVLGLRHSTESYFLAKDQTTEERMAGYLSSLITGRQAIKETRLFGLNPYLSASWRAISRKLLNERLALSLAQEKRGLVIDIASITFVFGAIAIFLVSVRNGNMTYGEFVALSGAMTELIAIVTWYIPHEVSELRRLMMYWTEFQEFLCLPENRASGQRITKGDIGSGIEFHNVRFKYPGTETEALKGVSFRLSKGEKDYATYPLTARENIGFGDLARLWDDAALGGAAARAGVKEFIESLPQKYDTYLGRQFGDTDLSGGQWQKIALARAFLRDADLVVLDEPTAAMDPLAELALFERFIELVQSRTAIMISHRLGAARLAGRIFVMRDGQVVEEGTHDALMARDGEYARLFRAQAQWYQ